MKSASRTCAQLPPESGAVHVDAEDAVAVSFIAFRNRIFPAIGIEDVIFVVPVVTGGASLLLSTSGIMKVVERRYVRPAKRAAPVCVLNGGHIWIPVNLSIPEARGDCTISSSFTAEYEL